MSNLLIVSGAATGIGAATGRLAVMSGWRRVALLYHRNVTGANGVAAEIEAMGGQAHVIAADLTQPKQIARLFERLKAMEPGRIGLVNAARGPAPEPGDPLGPEVLRAALALAPLGAAEVTRQALRLMRERGKGGAVVNLVAAAPRDPAEAASAGATLALTRSLASTLAPEGLRVNAIRPGPVDTPVQAEACAEAILFLLSERAASITGAALDVPGL